MSGEVYGHSGAAPLNQAAWNSFEADAGKKVTIVNMEQGWGHFETSEFEAARNRGAIPLVAMGLPPGVTLAEVADGSQDSVIRSWARQAKAWSYPFLFAPWREMNGAWYSWGQDPNFVAAWRHFHDLVVAEGATNVTWTWVPNSIWSDPASNPAPYYPGDAYVDWVGMDTYNWGLNPLQPDRWLSPEQVISPTLNVLKQIAPGKPVCICETASTEIGGNKADWIRNTLTTYLPHHPAIKAYVWFNWNVFQNGGRFDWQIESSTPAQQAFRDGIQSSIYRSTLPALPPLTKVPPPPAAAGGTGSEAADLSSTGQVAGEPQVEAGPNGTSTVVWNRSDGSNSIIQERRIAADGTPETSVHDLSESGQNAVEPQVALGADGTATVVWQRFNGSNSIIQERRIAADGTPETSVHDLSESGQNAVEPQVAVASDGTATVVWDRFDGSNSIVQERRIAAGGTPETSVHDLSESGQNAVEPQVAVASDGTATVVWDRFDGSNSIVQEGRIEPNGTPQASTTDLSAPGQDAGEPQVAIGPNGTAIVVWDRYDGTDYIVEEGRIAPDGIQQTSADDLSVSGQNALEPQVAVAPDGSASVVWDRFDGSNSIVQERRIKPNGDVNPSTANLSAPGQGSGEPQVAATNETEVTVTWRRFDGANDIVQGSTLEPAVSLQPASHNFGPITVSHEGPKQSFDLTNTGSEPLSIYSVSLGGGNPNQFSLSGLASCTIAPIAPGSSCEFSAGFNPTASGTAETQLAVASNAPSGLGYASLFGTGVPPLLRVDVPSNSFTIGKPKLNKRTGTASLPVTLPGPGSLELTGNGVVTLHAVSAGGRVNLAVRSRGKTKRKLTTSGSVRVKAKVTFSPVGGTADSQASRFELKHSRLRQA
ncbi:MAG TPA: choice-of-anchor D domain-containing protein [Candidatus Dormibacteraeota bacterium]|nr:choice-of-anchor D domain-containing protein [Candidatus Dormibacteraeota bacterium]